MFDSKTLAVLAIAHLIAFFLSLIATWMEHKGDKRSVVMSAYLYVAFISILTVIHYAPHIMNFNIPSQLASAFESMRYLAIAFFLMGMFELANKKRKLH